MQADFTKYINKLKAFDDSPNYNGFAIGEVIDEMINDDCTIKNIFDFLMQEYDDSKVPRLLQMIYELGVRDDHERVYKTPKRSKSYYKNLLKDGNKPYIVFIDMYDYYSMSEIYNFMVKYEDKYDIYIGSVLFDLYEIGYY